MKKSLKIVFWVLMCFCNTIISHAQSTLIGSSNNGDFENATPSLNWIIVNPVADALWFCGSTSTCNGSNGAYIGTASGDNNYNLTPAGNRVAHIYRDITFPAGETMITLSFNWKGQGQAANDGLFVYLIPTSTTPIANTVLPAGNLIGTSAGYRLNGACSSASFQIAAASVANYTSSVTMRLVFCWYNNTTVGTNPAATLDDVVLVSAPQAPFGCGGQTVISFLVGAGTNLDSVRFTTSTSALVYSMNASPTGTYDFNSIGLNPIDGLLYGLNYNCQLLKIGADANLNNIVNLGTITGAYNTSRASYAGCFDSNGNYWVCDQAPANDSCNIFTINTTTRVSTLIGNTRLRPSAGAQLNFVDIAFDPVSGILYGITSNCCGETTNQSTLYTINTTTGIATKIAKVSPLKSVFGLFCNDQGDLYGFASDGLIYYINKTTAVMTQVGNLGFACSKADASDCNYRVSHNLSVSSCSSASNPYTLTVNTRNYSGSSRSNVNFSLKLPTSFHFSQSAVTIQSDLTAMYGAGVSVSISSVESGTSNQINITNMTFPQNNSSTPYNTFTLEITGGTSYANGTQVRMMSRLTNLPSLLGSSDGSDDPTTSIPNDSSIITVNTSCATSLPIELINFSGKLNETNHVELMWITESELNNNYYEIERSNDGINYEIIAKVKGQGTSSQKHSYSYTDPLQLINIYYYRLKQVDYNGNHRYYNPIAFDYSSIYQLKKIQINPNITDGRISLNAYSETNQSVHIAIHNSYGQLINTRMVYFKDGENTEEIDLTDLSGGLYFIKVATANQMLIKKIIKF